MKLKIKKTLIIPSAPKTSLKIKKHQMFFYLMFWFLNFLFMGCSLVSKKDTSALPIQPDQKIKMQTEIQLGLNYLNSRQFSDAENIFNNFLQQNPHSIFEGEVQLALGQTKIGQQQFFESVTPLKSALGFGNYDALVWLAIAYEAMGDETKVFAALTDATNHAQELSVSVRFTELPARWASYYHRQGDYEQAMTYFEQANKGLLRLQEGLSDVEKKNQLSQAYYKMGVFSLNQLGADNAEKLIDTLNVLQLFLIRSMEQNQSSWSLLSLMNLKESYQTFKDFIINLGESEFAQSTRVHPTDSENSAVTKKIILLEKLLTTQQKAKNYVLLVNQENNSFLLEWDRFMNEFEEQTLNALNILNDKTPLTQDAKARQNSFKKGIKLVPTKNTTDNLRK